MTTYRIEGPHGVRLIAQGSRHVSGKTRGGWVVFRGRDNLRVDDPVFDGLRDAKNYAREVVGAAHE